ncbi:hypothetical protein B0H14DRAFT_3142472 [Mycena olivaceomarginata]|nr:hypothetical protein B0H14DRAFT_3142472 [Mycena olivaceomarginata]
MHPTVICSKIRLYTFPYRRLALKRGVIGSRLGVFAPRYYKSSVTSAPNLPGRCKKDQIFVPKVEKFGVSRKISVGVEVSNWLNGSGEREQIEPREDEPPPSQKHAKSVDGLMCVIKSRGPGDKLMRRGAMRMHNV